MMHCNSCLPQLLQLGAMFALQIIAHFASLKDALGEDLLSVCTYDSRGIGGSTTPQKLRQYSTRLMAEDALGLLDHLGWKKVHVIGLSLGGASFIPLVMQGCAKADYPIKDLSTFL